MSLQIHDDFRPEVFRGIHPSLLIVMSKSVISLYSGASVLDDVKWEKESHMLEDGSPSISIELSPRVVRLVTVLPECFVPNFFAVTLPTETEKEPKPESRVYWEEVFSLIESLPRDLVVEHVLVQLVATYAVKLCITVQEFIKDRMMAVFLAAFFRPTHLGLMEWRRVKALDIPAQMDLLKLLCTMNTHLRRGDTLFHSHRVLSIVLFKWAAMEIDERLDHTRDSLMLPSHLSDFGLGNGLLLIGSMSGPKWRQKFYQHWVRESIRPLSFEEFDHRTAIVRNDPVMFTTLLMQLPPTFGLPFEDRFAKEIYLDRDEPEDIGRQALAFLYKNVVVVWQMMRWDRSRLVQERLVSLAAKGYNPSAEEFATVVYRNFV